MFIAAELRRTAASRRACELPDDDGQEAFSNVVRFHTSATMPGTPTFWRTQIHKSRAIQGHAGTPPHLFVTLTADGV